MARFNHYLFIALFLTAVALIAWLSTRYTLESDWTHSGRNSLSEASNEDSSVPGSNQPGN